MTRMSAFTPATRNKRAQASGELLDCQKSKKKYFWAPNHSVAVNKLVMRQY